MFKQFPVCRVYLTAALAVATWQAEQVCIASLPALAEPPHIQAEKAPHDEARHPKGPIDPKADLALWSLVVFVLFVLVLKKMAWGPLITGLDRREAKIRDDISSAEAARIKSEQMLAAYAQKLDAVQDEIRAILAEARRNADQVRQDILASAEKEAEAAKQRAIHEIERVRDQALEELFSQVGRIVAEATEHVLGRALTDGDQERLIGEALTEFAHR